MLPASLYVSLSALSHSWRFVSIPPGAGRAAEALAPSADVVAFIPMVVIAKVMNRISE